MSWSSYVCAYCGASNDVEIDPSSGRRQEYVEDCQTCCRPNVLRIQLDKDGEAGTIDAQPENG